uniref:Uncharacterized protein n=2 Tax=Parascaris TaxID=6254 RepID=A0A915ACA3_PARUN
MRGRGTNEEQFKRVGVDTVEEDTFPTDSSMMDLTGMGTSALARKLCAIPCEKLDLQRKIGEGIFAMRSRLFVTLKW